MKVHGVVACFGALDGGIDEIKDPDLRAHDVMVGNTH